MSAVPLAIVSGEEGHIFPLAIGGRAAVDPYDLALTKIERNITRDRVYMLYLARPILFDLALVERTQHCRASSLSPSPEREHLRLSYGWKR